MPPTSPSSGRLRPRESTATFLEEQGRLWGWGGLTSNRDYCPWVGRGIGLNNRMGTGPPIPRVRTVEQLDQRYLLVPEKVKDAYLVHLIQNFQDEHEDWSIIIFTNTCK